jgi:hypothetical protein
MNEKGSGSVYDKKQKQKQKQKQKKPKTYSWRSLHFLFYYLFDKTYCNDHDSSLANLEDALESMWTTHAGGQYYCGCFIINKSNKMLILKHVYSVPFYKSQFAPATLSFLGMYCFFVCLMVFNATFNNISVILWRSVLLLEETGNPEKTIHISQVTDNLYHIMLYSTR